MFVLLKAVALLEICSTVDNLSGASFEATAISTRTSVYVHKIQSLCQICDWRKVLKLVSTNRMTQLKSWEIKETRGILFPVY